MHTEPLSRRLLSEGLGSALLAATVVGSGIMAQRLAGGNAAVALLALAVIPGTPSAPAIVAGCVLWLAFTAPADLAPPPGRLPQA